MPNWKYIADFSMFYRSDSFTVKEKVGLIAKNLDRIYQKTVSIDLEDIIYNFRDFSENSDELTEEDFDCLMEDLYNYADRDHIIWIKTHGNL